MSAPTMTGVVETGPPKAEPPPIAMLLPLFQSALTGSSVLFRLAIRSLLATVYPLRVIWSIVQAVLFPVIIVIKIALDFALFTPFAIIREVVVALYPVYVFCVVACIFGAAVGFFGHYISTAVLGMLARSTYFTQPPGASPTATSSTPQVTLRKRKRKAMIRSQ